VLDERCPLAGCTLFLEDGVYGRLRIIGRSNVHLRGQSRDGVRLRGVQIASCDGAIGPAGSYTRIDQAIAANEEWAFECVRNRQRSFSFANLTFDGRGDILAWDGVDHLVTNAALVTRTAADVVVEDAHVTGYKDGGSVHDGVIMGNYHTDGLLVRRVVFDDGPGTYVFADGCFGCAVLDSQTGYSRAGHFVMFVNDDATDDINQNGRYDEDELRLSRYIIFRGNTVGHTNAYAFSVQGAFSLIENNTTTGWVSDFALFQTRRPFNHPPGTYVYKHFGHVVRNNTIDSAFDFVRFDMPDNCREVPSLSPDECLQAGQLTVANNSMANESRLIEDILWTRGNMPAHLADFWPAEWPKHELIVATRNTGGWAGGRPATRTESR